MSEMAKQGAWASTPTQQQEEFPSGVEGPVVSQDTHHGPAVLGLSVPSPHAMAPKEVYWGIAAPI